MSNSTMRYFCTADYVTLRSKSSVSTATTHDESEVTLNTSTSLILSRPEVPKVRGATPRAALLILLGGGANCLYEGHLF
jgi:hypothetical protein